MIKHLENIKAKIESLSGSCVIIELKLRLLAENNSFFRGGLYQQLDKEGKGRNEYWNCSLNHLVNAFDSMFNGELSATERKIIKSFKKARDKMQHGDLVALLKEINVSQDGQQILSSGKRNQLIWPDDKDEAVKNQMLRQAILRFDTNETVQAMNYLCEQFNLIIDKFLGLPAR